MKRNDKKDIKHIKFECEEMETIDKDKAKEIIKWIESKVEDFTSLDMWDESTLIDIIKEAINRIDEKDTKKKEKGV